MYENCLRAQLEEMPDLPFETWEGFVYHGTCVAHADQITTEGFRVDQSAEAWDMLRMGPAVYGFEGVPPEWGGTEQEEPGEQHGITTALTFARGKMEAAATHYIPVPLAPPFAVLKIAVKTDRYLDLEGDALIPFSRGLWQKLRDLTQPFDLTIEQKRRLLAPTMCGLLFNKILGEIPDHQRPQVCGAVLPVHDAIHQRGLAIFDQSTILNSRLIHQDPLNEASIAFQAVEQ